MRVVFQWETHNRRYSVNAIDFLKEMDIMVSDDKLVATAKKLLEQNEAEPIKE